MIVNIHWSREDPLPLLRYCELSTWKFFTWGPNMSRLKPISVSNFMSPSTDNMDSSPSGPICPPVTVWRGNPGLVRNNFDESGFFRRRTDSAAKRKRTETQQEIDAAYNMSRDYLINNPPPKPTLDPNSIKEVLVTATVLASSVKPILDKPDTSEDMKSVVTMLMVMLSSMEAVVEKGIEPLSAVVTSAAKSGKGSGNENGKSCKSTPPPRCRCQAPPPRPQ
jgi:hypothetical protein